MQVYLVGGAVRDELLGLPITERDWVVVGASPKKMRDQGYLSVGKHFPVFLHPKSHEEYALARTEQKKGHGYHGFEFHAAPTVTLEEDLCRRDLTINAIAKDAMGNLYDPYQGQEDLKNKVLRHVSAAFDEDPLRVLRVARFAARFHHLGFTIANATLQRMRVIVKSDELSYLSIERIWTEIEKALRGPAPKVFIDVLHQVQALEKVLPEVAQLFNKEIDQYNPKINAASRSLDALEQISAVSDDTTIRFAVLMHNAVGVANDAIKNPSITDLDKVADQKKLTALVALRQRLKIPNNYYSLTTQVCRFHHLYHHVFNLTPKVLLNLLQHLDYRRRPDQFKKFIQACLAIYHPIGATQQSNYLEQCATIAKKYSTLPKNINSNKPELIKQAIEAAQIKAIAQIPIPTNPLGQL